MTAYLTREAAEALRTALEARSGSLPFGASGIYVTLAAALDALDSLPVVGAVPAEEALERSWPLSTILDARGQQANADRAAVRHALRAAQVQAQASNHSGRFELREEDGRRFWFGSEEGWKDGDEIGEEGVLTIDAKHFAIGTILTLNEPWPEAAAAQAQADAPPPPDVIRRGHEAWKRLASVIDFHDDMDTIRAAMHPLPKEETT